ncbi:MAG: UDP-N-acetylmuramoyl-tripeptide--D-alanyl-D-alanine ligase [Actinobacteria bacterium]|nr:UDP-N-acetylmuramoyl-tripeptide--D-alanyl-D-alanine ligase [Actinomycetota bacterium]MBU1944484.1 UDP-N-acetylmuramoyl-tripeptide--D-alanyl-D-alanine ligase [Actinomycetota bacterium]MBU2688649.1 UDP-N-acetylmuramoyl-tripeptide--D-alanyl-D-alanine ligase [Actinomycetota bacterium]
MKRISLADVARATGGVLEGPAGLTVADVCTDSRRMRKGALFFALEGERYDGHAFLAEAAQRGARAAVVRRRNPLTAGFRRGEPALPLVLVGNTLRAMGDLAAMVRADLDLEVFAVTGTTGKTCTKDFLVSCLSRRYRVTGSAGSYNNEVGIPLTIFSVKPADEALVCEMGARHAGDIKRLAEIAGPSRGIITNVGAGHLELFKTVENVARTKAELAATLPARGTLFVNADDPEVRKIAKKTRARVVRFGLSRNADFRAVEGRLDAMGRPIFTLRGPGFSIGVELPATGRHQVYNALAAAACAGDAGVSPPDIAAGLNGAELSPWRTEVWRSPAGFMVINDAYNANPQSMEAALDTLCELGCGARTVAVLGQMAELGRDSGRYHRAAGTRLESLDVDLLVTVGRRARDYGIAALEAGMPRGSVFRCEDPAEAERLLADILEPGDVVLVKASRLVGLEELAGRLAARDFTGEREAADV